MKKKDYRVCYSCKRQLKTPDRAQGAPPHCADSPTCDYCAPCVAKKHAEIRAAS